MLCSWCSFKHSSILMISFAISLSGSMSSSNILLYMIFSFVLFILVQSCRIFSWVSLYFIAFDPLFGSSTIIHLEFPSFPLEFQPIVRPSYYDTRQRDHYHVHGFKSRLDKINLRYNGVIVWNSILSRGIPVDVSQAVFSKQLKCAIIDGTLKNHMPGI